MKKGALILLTLLPLSLSSCSGYYDTFYVPFNLDYQFNNDQNKLPVTIEPKDLRAMFESKQSFALYFYSDTCSACQITSELLKTFFDNRNNQIQFFKLSLSQKILDERNEQYLTPYDFLFTKTPQILVFYQGQLTLSLPSNKFASGYPAFESALNNVLKRSLIYTTSVNNGLSYFLENNKNDYLIYLYNIKDIDETTYISTSYKTYQDVIYPIMSKAENATLLIDVSKAERQLMDNLDVLFNISDYDTQNLAIYKYTDGLLASPMQGIINCDNENNINDLKNLMLDKLYTNEL